MDFNLKGFLGGLTDTLTAPLEAFNDALGYGVKSLFGQSPMDQYERQLSRNKEYQKEMIDYTNTANLAYNKELTSWNNEQNKQLAQHYYDNYQSPQAMMSAYKQAGLNPALAVGAGSISPVQSSLSSGGSSAPSSGASFGSYQRQQISTLYSDLKARKEQNTLNTQYLREKVESESINNLFKLADLFSFSSPNSNDEDLSSAERKAIAFENMVSTKRIFKSDEYDLKISNAVLQRYRNQVDLQDALDTISAMESLKSFGLTPAMIRATKALYESKGAKETYKNIKEIAKKSKMDNEFNESLKYVFKAVDNDKELNQGNTGEVIKMVLAMLFRYSGAD